MGVLKQFVDKGWIDSVDIISSVSGGGYSAYYFYSKAIYMQENFNKKLTMKDFFKDCVMESCLEEEGEYQNYVRNYLIIMDCVG